MGGITEPSGAEAYLTAEAEARVQIDKMLAAAGWVVQEPDQVNLAAARGVAVREFILSSRPMGNRRSERL